MADDIAGMTPENALELLDAVVARHVGSRHDHKLLAMALSIVADAINRKGRFAGPEAPPQPR